MTGAIELAVPTGWWVEPLVEARLRRCLAEAAPDVDAVAALAAPLEPGTSDRTAAEWSCLAPVRLVEAEPGRLRGVAAVRSGVAHRAAPDGIEVDGRTVVDVAARSHDPTAPVGSSGPAGPEARPPFPCRSVAVLLSGDADPAALSWAAGVADELIGLGVEARVAVHDGTVPTTRTRPCLPTPELIEQLRPDVVIALDPTAARWAEVWSEPVRSTALATWDPDGSGTTLVPWRLGVAQGRLRARLGPSSVAHEVAEVVARLAAGPVPGPPVDAPLPVAVDVAPPRRRLRPPPAVALITTHRDPATRHRARALRDAVLAAGRSVLATEPEAPDTRAGDADLLVVVGADAPAATSALVATRHRAGLPTLVEVRPEDLDADVSGWPDAVGELRPAASGLVADAGAATFASRLLRWRTILPPGHRLIAPTPLPLELARHVHALRAAPRPVGAGPPVIGWVLDHLAVDGPLAPLAEAVGEGLARAVGDLDVRVELVGAPGTVPPAWFDDDRIAVVGDPTPAAISRWTALVATPPSATLLAGSPSHLLVAAALEVPILWAAPVEAETAWAPLPEAPPALAGPDAWASAVAELVLDPDARAARGAATRAAVERLVDPDAVTGAPERWLRQAVAVT